MAKGRVVIHEAGCKGCALCTTACAQGVLVIAHDRLNARGYHPVELEDVMGRCTGCGLCAVICPEACITVYKVRSPKSGAPVRV
jgi:2-oxoglutarate ferredoxin oxidoreductase subunit delta